MIELADKGILYTMGLNGNTEQPIYNPITPLDPNDPSLLLKGINPLYALIQLNKWMVLYQNYFPRKLWGAAQEVLIPDWALVTEIKASKAGSSLQWSGPVTFYVDDGVFDRCTITETVVFNLYLGNESMMKSGNNAITIKNLTVVGPKVDAIGSNRGTDGERSASNPSDTASLTAGEIDLQYNSVTRKYQSGNKNILAKLTTDLNPAVNSPALSRLLTNVIADDLNDDKNTYSYIPSSGLAMPINAQNAMPLQWSPTYELTKEARCSATGNEKTKKISVPVFNFNSRRFYPSGEDVLLTEIDGLWHVSSLGEANATPTDVVKTSVGKWGSFTYMATSSEFFFKAKKVSGGAIVNVTPRSAELNFHKLYYKYRGNDDKPLNYGITGIDYGTAGGYNSSAPFNTSTHEEWFDERGWFQTTSFDYLDSQIFGIRGKDGTLGANGDLCSISSTSATLNAAGNPIDNISDYTSRNSAHTGTFFGCVFPAGYQGTNVYDNARAWDVVSASKGSISTQADYFDTSNPANISPFQNDLKRNNSNVKCLSTEGGHVLDPIGEGGNKWARAKSKLDASLFQLGADAARKTIPADVMLNASPDGKYGSPIKPIGLFNDMNTTGFKSNAYIADLVTGGVWLRKSPLTGTSNPNDSAFDFEPIKKGNLMFRPLKLEAYLQFGLPTGYIQYKNETDIAAETSLTGTHGVQTTVQGFYAEAARTQADNTFPISYYAATREKDNCKDNRIGEAGGALRWGAWVPNKINYTRIHNAGYWDSSIGGMRWTTKLPTDGDYAKKSNWNGAGAYGVITTSNKVKANESIKFTTKNLYGMSAAGGSNPIQNEYIKVPQRQDISWGVGNLIDSYKQENIIDLSVRIYQGHDSSSTVYDPRYFAVHHFNPGVEFLDGVYRGGAVGSIPVNALGAANQAFRNLLQEDFKNLKGSDGNILNSVKYNYPQASGVDVKIPSRYTTPHENNGVHSPVSLSDETFVFSDATSEGAIKKPPIMLETYWNVDPRRTGKLLPYRYEVLTLTIPRPIGVLAQNVDEFPNLQKTVLELRDQLIVKNRGKNYKEGDIVGISALNILLRVWEVSTPDGGIKKLEVLENGENLPPSFCMPSSSTIGSLTPKHKVTTIALIAGSTGKDFEAYFVSAQVRKKTKCDPKPFLIKDTQGNEISRIASDISGPSHPTSTTGGSGFAEGASYVNDIKTVTFEVGEGSNIKSADSSYDIFFHFHNDITMTWLACGSVANDQPHGDYNNITESIEQHITIESINLT